MPDDREAEQIRAILEAIEADQAEAQVPPPRQPMLPANDNRGGKAKLDWWLVLLILVMLAALAVGVLRAVAAEAIAGVARVLDGDTIEIGSQPIRIWGIDAPEGGQRCVKQCKLWQCDEEATTALRNLLDQRPVSCDYRSRDRYGRIVASCAVEGEDVGAWMVGQGWALDFTRYSKGFYAEKQREAQTAGRGLWQGEFERPWEWRDSLRGKRRQR